MNFSRFGLPDWESSLHHHCFPQCLVWSIWYGTYRMMGIIRRYAYHVNSKKPFLTNRLQLRTDDSTLPNYIITISAINGPWFILVSWLGSHHSFCLTWRDCNKSFIQIHRWYINLESLWRFTRLKRFWKEPKQEWQLNIKLMLRHPTRNVWFKSTTLWPKAYGPEIWSRLGPRIKR